MSTLSTIRSLHQKEKDEANAVDGGRHGRGSEAPAARKVMVVRQGTNLSVLWTNDSHQRSQSSQ